MGKELGSKKGSREKILLKNTRKRTETLRVYKVRKTTE